MDEAARLLLDDADGESLLRMVLEKLPAVLWAVDSRLRVTSSTGGQMALFTREPGELVGKTLHELIPCPREQAPLIAAHERALRGEMASCEITWHERTYQVRTYPLGGRDETIVGCAALLQDVTKWRVTEEFIRKAYEELEWRVQERTARLEALNKRLQQEVDQREQVQKSLRTTEKHFRLMFEEGPLGMAIIDRDSRLLQVNRALCRMLGYGEREMLGKSLLEMTHPADQTTDRLLTRRLFDGEVSNLTLERRYRRKDGQTVWARLTPTCLHDRDGRVKYGFNMIEDITSRKQAEETLRRAERLASIGTLAAGLAHELNNPLGAIILSAGAALRAMDQPDGRDILRRSLENVQSGAARCSQIVKSVSQFAHEEVSKKWSNDLIAVVRRAIRGTSRLAEARKVVVHFDSENKLPKVDINPTGMEQVFINVISNAILASESGNQVRIWGECESERIRFHVEDDGCGMSDAQRRQACDPFFTTRQQQGCAGLGLSIAYGIVEQHGGTLRLKSRLGEGTTVTVVLPLMTPDGMDRKNVHAQAGDG